MAAHFDVFLSHNSKDKPTVRELAEALVARGLRVWLDEWELVPGRPWQEALEEVIETVGAAAVLVGRDGLGPWEVPEMRSCLSEYVDRKLPVIPVLLPGTPEQPRLPLFLKQFTWVDLRDGLDAAGLDRLQWGITGRRPGTPAPVPSAASHAGGSASRGARPRSPALVAPEDGPLGWWREKLAYLQKHEVIAVDPAQKFTLKKQIEEAKQKIRELEG